jgi:hypothetical protein
MDGSTCTLQRAKKHYGDRPGMIGIYEMWTLSRQLLASFSTDFSEICLFDTPNGLQGWGQKYLGVGSLTPPP